MDRCKSIRCWFFRITCVCVCVWKSRFINRVYHVQMHVRTYLLISHELIQTLTWHIGWRLVIFVFLERCWDVRHIIITIISISMNTVLASTNTYSRSLIRIWNWNDEWNYGWQMTLIRFLNCMRSIMHDSKQLCVSI